VLVISHSAIQPTYHRKFEEIAKKGDVILRVLVPDTWFENDRTLRFSGRYVNQNLIFYPKEVAFHGYGSRFFFTKDIMEYFWDFQPHIIHLEEEPWSLCALQTIFMRRIFCPRSKLIFRTSLSVPIELKFSPLASLIERLTFRESDYAFILSERAGEILRQKGYKKGMCVSPNGVDTQIFRKMDVKSLKSGLGIKEGEFVVGYVGRLLRMKGLDTLLEAFSMLEGDCRLLIVGSGIYKNDMLSLASQLGIDENMILIDAVPAEEVPQYINCMSVLVLPSITTPGWVEFFGRVLVEAMVCQVPVIGSNSGEISNVVDDAGLIFREGEANDLRDKLKMMIEDKKLRLFLADKGFKRAKSLFTWESIAQDTYATYLSLQNPSNNLY
jgi:glycosyltransferase involved in cell wall biosynthesis